MQKDDNYCLKNLESQTQGVGIDQFEVGLNFDLSTRLCKHVVETTFETTFGYCFNHSFNVIETMST